MLSQAVVKQLKPKPPAVKATPAQAKPAAAGAVKKKAEEEAQLAAAEANTDTAKTPAAENNASKKTSANMPAAEEGTVTIDALKLSLALFGMPTTPSLAEMLYEMDGATVKLVNADLYGTDPGGWYLLIGDGTPRIVCAQKTKNAKRLVVALKKRMPNATVTGEWKWMADNIVWLENCTVDGL